MPPLAELKLDKCTVFSTDGLRLCYLLLWISLSASKCSSSPNYARGHLYCLWALVGKWNGVTGKFVKFFEMTCCRCLPDQLVYQ
ncbi:unnamed protein product [Urochloa humidicola]